MKTLIEDGWRLVRDGVTTPAEVLRVSKDEGTDGFAVERVTPCPSSPTKPCRPTAPRPRGSIEAGGRQDAARMLEERGLTPVRLTETAAAPRQRRARALKAARPHAADVFASKSKQVSVRRARGFHPLALQPARGERPAQPRAHHSLQGIVATPPPSAKWRELHDLVIDGVPLAEAMNRSPEVFPRVYVAMVEAGEAGGFLDVVLAQIADFQAREKETARARSISALMYPAVLLFLAIAVLIFLLVFFIPRFQTLFAGFDAALPAAHAGHRRRSAMSMRSYGFYLLAGVGRGDLVRADLVREREQPAPLGVVAAARAGHRSARRARSRWRASAACSARCSAPAFR